MNPEQMTHEQRLKQETWYDKYSGKERLYPHYSLMPENKGLRCSYCKVFFAPGDDGFIEIEGVGCTERGHQLCPWCGETPLCAPDCVGIRMLLSDTRVYLTGDNPFEVRHGQP